MENTTTLLEQLEKANELAKQVATMEADERKAYMDKLLEVYNDFRETIFGLTDEVGIIMKNYEWILVKSSSQDAFALNNFLENSAEIFALENGFSLDTVKKLYGTKNWLRAYREEFPENRHWNYHYFVLKRRKY